MNVREDGVFTVHAVLLDASDIFVFHWAIPFGIISLIMKNADTCSCRQSRTLSYTSCPMDQCFLFYTVSDIDSSDNLEGMLIHVSLWFVLMCPNAILNFISLVTSCFGLQGEAQTAHVMLTGH